MSERRTAAISARLTGVDLVGRLAGWRAFGVQVAVASVALLTMIALRHVINLAAPGVAPYAAVYPVVLLATIAGRLRAGLVVWAGSIAYVAFVTLPPAAHPLWAATYGPTLTLINLVSTLLVVLMAETASAQAGELLAEREERIAERDLLLEEVDHRLKNNLAILSGLLELQMREIAHPETREILSHAAARLQSLGHVYEQLRYEPGSVSTVDAAALVERLCASLRAVLGLDGPIILEVAADPAPIGRDRASALALLVNEVVTNAAKHAFIDRVGGRIHVRFERNGYDGALLEIVDDGRGMNLAGRYAGRGRKLLDALAGMAGGRLDVASGDGGTRYRLKLPHLT